jgi:biotin synthase
VNSVPVNFLVPVKGTPLEDIHQLTPGLCLKILALFRLICPDREIRISGGRELHLRSLQALGLYLANSIFIGDYLTTKGQAGHLDLEMIRDMGFEVLNQPELTLSDNPEDHPGSDCGESCGCSSRSSSSLKERVMMK